MIIGRVLATKCPFLLGFVYAVKEQTTNSFCLLIREFNRKDCVNLTEFVTAYLDVCYHFLPAIIVGISQMILIILIFTLLPMLSVISIQL